MKPIKRRNETPSKNITIRFYDEEIKEINEMASKKKMTRSDYIRGKVLTK